MGSTRLPCRQRIEQERRAWASFTRAPRRADQVVLDRLFDGAKRHAQTGVSRSRPRPFEVIAMAMLLEHHKPLERLLARCEGSRSSGLVESGDRRPPGAARRHRLGWNPREHYGSTLDVQRRFWRHRTVCVPCLLALEGLATLQSACTRAKIWPGGSLKSCKLLRREKRWAIALRLRRPLALDARQAGRDSYERKSYG